MTTEASPAYTNHLATEKSPYLLQHAHNPVDWYPWGEEAFAKARKEQKPIFLSIGYSTCHWCHVMEHESFENKDIARLLNENFISIKVDREERPDVDRVYMAFVQATTGGGGWPMSVFLTPELEPFAGGTYFPPADNHGRPGFPSILKQIAQIWKTDRERVLKQGSQITSALRQYAAGSGEAGSVAGREEIHAAFKQIAGNFDPDWGGFGGAPKFPRPVTLNFLFRVYARDRGGADVSEGRQALSMNLLTLGKMAEGGMHDHLGGGFHRYSVDAHWHVPHFEKMLYDQAQLAISYTDAFQITHVPLYEDVARDILDYVRRDMTSKEGGFYSAEDADSQIAQGKPARAEGAFYVWTQEEIGRVLGGDAAMFDYFYGVEPGGNAPEENDPHGEFKGKNILIQRHSVADAAKHFSKGEEEVRQSLARSRKALLEARAARPRPSLDDKVITGWNGLMISAFARASQVFDDPALLDAGRQAAVFAETHLYDPATGTLHRSYREGPGKAAGFTDDYAFLIQGLLDLYEASFDIHWLQWAEQLQKKQDELFQDKAGGGYFGVTGEDPHILLRMKEDYDGAEPSPNSVAALNLLRLAQFTGDAGQETLAKKTISAFGEQLHKTPSAMPQMLVALDFALEKPLQIVIAGKPAAEDTRALLREVNRHFLPDKILLGADGEAAQKWLGERLDFIQTAGPLKGKAAAFVCEDRMCKLPTNDPVELSALLDKGK